MPKKVADLTGAELDYWVAKAEGIEGYSIMEFDSPFNGVGKVKRCAKKCWYEGHPWDAHIVAYMPSVNWHEAGPIIDREGIDIQHVHIGKPEGKDDPDFFWAASMYGQEDDTPDWEGVVSKKIHHGYAKTPLEASMRCYVSSRFGDEVEE